MEGEREFVRTEEHISTSLDGEEVILHSESEIYFGLNEVGTAIWDRLGTPRTVDELARSVHEEFDVSMEQSREDVESFLEELEAADLVESPNDEDR